MTNAKATIMVNLIHGISLALHAQKNFALLLNWFWLILEMHKKFVRHDLNPLRFIRQKHSHLKSLKSPRHKKTKFVHQKWLPKLPSWFPKMPSASANQRSVILRACVFVSLTWFYDDCKPSETRAGFCWITTENNRNLTDVMTDDSN